MSTLTVSTISAIGSSPLSLGANGTFPVLINAYGLGVGVTPVSGGAKLDVVDVVGNASCRVWANHASGAAVSQVVAGNGIASSEFAYTYYLNSKTNPYSWKVGTYGSDNFTIRDETAAANRLVIDSDGMIGVSITPGVWHPTSRAMQFGYAGALWGYSTTQMNLTQGMRYDSNGHHRYLQSGVRAGSINLNEGALYYQQAAPGTLGAAATLYDAFQITQGGNMGVKTVPAPWGDPYRAIEVSASGRGIAASAGTTYVTGNAYYDGADWRRHETGVGLLYSQDVQHSWYVSPTGTAGGNIVWTQALVLTNAGDLLSTGNGLLGYGVGSGGQVSQLTSKSTSVRLDKAAGRIILNTEELASNTTVFFQLLNSRIGVNDVVTVCIRGGGSTTGAYNVWVDSVSAGSATICVRNISSGPLSEAVNISFAVVKASVN